MVMDIHAILKKYWNYSSFRPMQEEIILSVMEGKDTLALLPTGGGKSICFQIPALAKEGICIVISPLIALMKDQVDTLLLKKIPAATIHSGLHQREIELILRDCINGKIKFLYLSPERLKNELLKNCVRQMNVNLLAVDEAHCISQWGYDFRPSYLDIITFKEWLPPHVPVLALTATATKQVIKDIQVRLKFEKENVFRKSFYRENLTYFVLKEENKHKRLLQIITRTPGTGIVYVNLRRRAIEWADFLIRNNVSAEFYHAGLTIKEREERQNRWKTNKTKVIVTTNAFGMGIDKPDVRFVVHINVPSDLESYFQEAGRGGRDEQQAYAILLYDKTDIVDMRQIFEESYPPIETIRNVYQALCNFFQIPIGNGEGASFDFDAYTFTKKYKFKPLVAHHCLTFLERAGFISLTDAIKNISKIHIPISRDDLYRFQVANERYDNFIKFLLRHYAGLCSLFVPIVEKTISYYSGIPVDIVINVLKQLADKGVIIYQPHTENPRLTFLQDRIEDRYVVLSKQVYGDRKRMTEDRLDAMIHYITSAKRCRNKLLLEYFDEKHVVRCGKCDACLREQREGLGTKEFNAIRENIILALQKEDLTILELFEKLNYDDKKKTGKVVSWLLDNNDLIQEDFKLSLNKKKYK
jgi:ATP-dependent DNA helicase RecQ